MLEIRTLQNSPRKRATKSPVRASAGPLIPMSIRHPLETAFHKCLTDKSKKELKSRLIKSLQAPSGLKQNIKDAFSCIPNLNIDELTQHLYPVHYFPQKLLPRQSDILWLFIDSL